MKENWEKYALAIVISLIIGFIFGVNAYLIEIEKTIKEGYVSFGTKIYQVQELKVGE